MLKWDTFRQVMINKLTGLIEECAEDEEKEIYFLDGSGFDHNVKIGYGWIEKGKEKLIKTNTGIEKINVNGAYNLPPYSPNLNLIERLWRYAKNEILQVYYE